jgi:O-antigen ligase/polysaccharide polymerase Wzy-like membrane protein
MGRNKRAKGKSPPATEPCPEATQAEHPVSKAVLAGIVTALFVTRPLYPSESVASEGDGLPVVMMWLLALMLWAILVARGNLCRVRFGWPDMAMALFVLWHSIAALWAVAYESPRPALNMLWEWLGLGVAFFLARQAFSSAVQRRAVGAVMVALAVVVSLYGLYQYSVELPAARELYEQSSDEMLRDAGIWYPPGSPGREMLEQRLASLEPMATFALTNSLAGFLAPWAMVALAVSVVLSRRLSVRQRVVIASLLIPLGLCLLLTKSRSAYLACACGAVAIAAISWGGRRTLLRTRRRLLTVGIAAVLIVGAILGALSVGGLDIEVLSEAPKSLGYRLQYWQASAAMIRDLPLFGCGPGSFQHRYTAYKLPEASEEIADPHNFLIEMWATAGTPALLALLAVGVAFLLCVLSPTRRTQDDVQSTGADSGESEASPIFWGALGGVMLSLPVGAMSAAPPSLLVPLAALPLGGLVLAMLIPWVARGDDSAMLWTLPAMALLVHLLFSGGFAFPGVAVGLWLLLALALNVSACGDRPVGSGVGALVLGGVLALVATCFLTGYQPTLVSRTQIQRAYAGEGDPRVLMRKAVEADPWAIGPREGLADVFHQQWMAAPNAETMRQFDRAVQEALVRAPRAASLRHKFGLAYLECFGRSREKNLLTEAIRMLESAVSLYPNDCRKRADLAEAYLLAGGRDGFQRERAEAIRLDRLTPHLDKKLTEEQRQRLTRIVLAPEVRAPVPE